MKSKNGLKRSNGREGSKPLPENLRGEKIWCSDLQRRRVPGPGLRREHSSPGWGLSTRSVHAGQYDDPDIGAVGTPIYQNTTFYLNNETYDSIKDGRAREHFVYSRYGNPSQWAVQEKLASLEGAESAVAFSSGMAAITTTLLALLDRGSHVITSRDLYGGTYNFFNEDLPQYGMSVTFVDPTGLDQIEAAINEKTKLFFFESLTNPLLKLVPLQGLVRLAEKYDCRVVIDNTFLTPVNLQPLSLGVDVVVHSASKYLNGHSDLIAGAAAGSRKLLDRIWVQMLKQGGSLDPHACFLLERGLKTLAIRMHTHNHNALHMAQFLESRPEVRRVYYPGLPSYPQFDLSSKMLGGQSGMISFEVFGGNRAAKALLASLKIPKAATSLGGVESLVSLPYNTSHASLMSSQLKAIGINDGLIRLSVGIENHDDLLEDFKQAFERVNIAERSLS